MYDRISYYQSRIKQLESEQVVRRKKLTRISIIRLILFVLAAGAIVLAIVYTSLFYWLSFAFFAAFIWQVKQYVLATNESGILDEILRLNERELEFMMGNKSVFAGGDNADAVGHIYAIDLDIFGKGSLFQSVNRTGTWEGRNLVIDTLLHLPKSAVTVSQRKEAITELTEDVDWRQRFRTIGAMAGETSGDMPAMRQWLGQEDFFATRGSWIWIARAAGAVSVGVILWSIFILQAFYPIYFIVLLIVNSTIRSLFGKGIKTYFDTFGSRTKLFEKFGDLFRLVSKKQVKSEIGKEHFHQVDEASTAFFELSRLSNRADQRMNPFVGLVMNGLFLYDVWCIRSIEEWRVKYKNSVEGWIVSLANIDMLSSFANYQFNHPGFVEPTVVDGKSFIKATAIGHPLIPMDQSVKNDYEIGVTSKAHIVTGSNMAGKSTFIRTVGLNLILAMNGLPVCAKEFSCSVVSIASCIRITDSLEEHASYFRAELIRLEQIVKLLGTGEPYIVLLDEILRGTNSDDKRMGTLAFFRKLKEYNCLAILATHDLVIGKLEEQFPEHYANYCFESELKGAELHFDYKLRKGVSASTNATFLMRSLGLID